MVTAMARRCQQRQGEGGGDISEDNLAAGLIQLPRELAHDGDLAPRRWRHCAGLGLDCRCSGHRGIAVLGSPAIAAVCV